MLHYVKMYEYRVFQRKHKVFGHIVKSQKTMVSNQVSKVTGLHLRVMSLVEENHLTFRQT